MKHNAPPCVHPSQLRIRQGRRHVDSAPVPKHADRDAFPGRVSIQRVEEIGRGRDSTVLYTKDDVPGNQPSRRILTRRTQSGHHGRGSRFDAKDKHSFQTLPGGETVDPIRMLDAQNWRSIGARLAQLRHDPVHCVDRHPNEQEASQGSAWLRWPSLAARVVRTRSNASKSIDGLNPLPDQKLAHAKHRRRALRLFALHRRESQRRAQCGLTNRLGIR